MLVKGLNAISFEGFLLLIRRAIHLDEKEPEMDGCSDDNRSEASTPVRSNKRKKTRAKTRANRKAKTHSEDAVSIKNEEAAADPIKLEREDSLSNMEDDMVLSQNDTDAEEQVYDICAPTNHGCNGEELDVLLHGGQERARRGSMCAGLGEDLWEAIDETPRHLALGQWLDGLPPACSLWDTEQPVAENDFPSFMH
jgi:hypothetical protein